MNISKEIERLRDDWRSQPIHDHKEGILDILAELDQKLELHLHNRSCHVLNPPTEPELKPCHVCDTNASYKMTPTGTHIIECSNKETCSFTMKICGIEGGKDWFFKVWNDLYPS